MVIASHLVQTHHNAVDALSVGPCYQSLRYHIRLLQADAQASIVLHLQSTRLSTDGRPWIAETSPLSKTIGSAMKAYTDIEAGVAISISSAKYSASPISTTWQSPTMCVCRIVRRRGKMA